MSKNFYQCADEQICKCAKDIVMCVELEPTARPEPLHLIIDHYRKKVEDIGVEPMTPCVQGRCSSQLS